MDTHINKLFDLKSFEVTANLGSQEDAGTCAELAVLFIQFASEGQLLKVHKRHGHRRLLIATVLLSQFAYLFLQTEFDQLERTSELPGLGHLCLFSLCKL